MTDIPPVVFLEPEYDDLDDVNDILDALQEAAQ